MTLPAEHFQTLHDGHRTPLPGDHTFVEAAHRWSKREIDALTFAAAARRPLLVRGEAGCGKSQIARAAAAHCKTNLVVEVIHPRFEALELLYRFDVVQRLSDAQVPGTLDASNKKYVNPGAMWRALEGCGLVEDPLASEGATRAPATGSPPTPPVLLIDEIDKADAEVPNALLEILGNRSFKVDPLGGRVCSAGGRMPMIIITTNEERELPAAFVRRCAVLNLDPPKDERDFKAWLVERGRVHAHLRIEEDARTLAADQVWADRKVAEEAGFATVGLAEYIDLLHAVSELTAEVKGELERAKAQKERIQTLGCYALVKNPRQSQEREPVQPAKPAEKVA